MPFIVRAAAKAANFAGISAFAGVSAPKRIYFASFASLIICLRVFALGALRGSRCGLALTIVSRVWQRNLNQRAPHVVSRARPFNCTHAHCALDAPAKPKGAPTIAWMSSAISKWNALIQETSRMRTSYTRRSHTPAWSLLMNGALNPNDDSKNYNVLVVDDDPATRRMVTSYFEEHDVSASSAAGRQDLTRHLAVSEPSLIILDLRLGQEDGLDLLREIRSNSDVPVIITTGHRRDEIDRVVGLELGADDYITKPFGLRELLARIRAVLRRREAGQVAAQRDPERGRCRFGAWQLDRRNRRLSDASGIPVALTKGEYALLIAFLDAPPRPLSREHLLQATRIHEDVFDRSIDVQVLRLRRKLETDSNAPSIIQTERGIGYVFALPVEPL